MKFSIRIFSQTLNKYTKTNKFYTNKLIKIICFSSRIMLVWNCKMDSFNNKMHNNIILFLSKMEGKVNKIMEFSYKIINFNNKIANFSNKIVNFSNKIINYKGKIANLNNKITNFNNKTINFKNKTTNLNNKM